MKRKSSSENNSSNESKIESKINENNKDKKTKLVHWEPITDYEVSARDNEVFCF